MKPLGDVVQILNGYAFQSWKYCEEGIRVIRISDVQKWKMSDKDMKYYPTELEKEIEKVMLQENDLVMSLTWNVWRVAMLSKKDLPAALNQRVACIRPDEKRVLTRFLFHFFDQDSFEKDAMANATGGGQKNMSTNWLKNFQIPIPPLPVQEEIVRILDKFTSLEAELEAELEARKCQYEFYRNQLLAFDKDEIVWKTLGEVCERTKGIKITAWEMKQLDKWNGPIKIFAWWQTVAFVEYSDIPKEWINICPSIIVKSRWIIEFEYYDKPFSHKNEMRSYRTERKDVDIKFVYYYLKTKESYFQKIWSKMQMPQISISDTEKFLIPLPPLEQQEAIVYILDHFDQLANDLTAGLPAELHLRQQQYAYYRDILLNFSSELVSERERERALNKILQILKQKSFDSDVKRIIDILERMLEKVEWKTLGEIVNILDNQRKPIAKINRKAWIYPYYWANGIQDYIDEYIFDGIFLLLWEDGSVINKDWTPVLNRVSGKIWVNNHAHVLSEKSEIADLKYIYYYLQIYDVSKVVKGNIPKITQQELKSFLIPIPSLATQQRIVTLLDKFDTLVNDLTTGLPAELESRKKQYEHYRNQLLTFTPLKE